MSEAEINSVFSSLELPALRLVRFLKEGKMPEPRLELTSSIRDYFFDTLGRVNQLSNPTVEKLVIEYLSDVLSTVKGPNQLASCQIAEECGATAAVPNSLRGVLGAELLCAESMDSPGQRFALLKKVAEEALLFTGLYSRHLERRKIDPGYYMTIGIGAYDRLAGATFYGNRERTIFRLMRRDFSLVSSLLKSLSDAWIVKSCSPTIATWPDSDRLRKALVVADFLDDYTLQVNLAPSGDH